jgi:hypothetical protein
LSTDLSARTRPPPSASSSSSSTPSTSPPAPTCSGPRRRQPGSPERQLLPARRRRASAPRSVTPTSAASCTAHGPARHRRGQPHRPRRFPPSRPSTASPRSCPWPCASRRQHCCSRPRRRCQAGNRVDSRDHLRCDEHRWQRLRLCAATDCRFAFYDASRNRTGIWCSMSTCGNRAGPCLSAAPARPRPPGLGTRQHYSARRRSLAAIRAPGPPGRPVRPPAARRGARGGAPRASARSDDRWPADVGPQPAPHALIGAARGETRAAPSHPPARRPRTRIRPGHRVPTPSRVVDARPSAPRRSTLRHPFPP